MSSPSDLQSPENSADTIRETLQDYALITMDADGRIVQWSEGAQKMFGYRPEEVVGRPFALIFTPEDQATNQPQSELAGAARKGVSEDERWHIRKDSTRIWASGTVRALRNESGEVTGFTKLARDITTQKLAELQKEALLRREQTAREEAERKWKHLEEISENIPAFIALLRLPDQVYVFANRTFRDAVGQRQLMGLSFRDAHPETNQEFFQILDQVSSTGQTYRAAEKPAAGRYFDFVLQPMRSEAGQYEAVLIFAVDVSDRVAGRQTLERLTLELQAEGERLKEEVAERKRAEEIAETRAELVQEQAAMINLAHDAIMALSLDGTIELWNRGAEETYGWKQSEVLGRNMHDLLKTTFPQPLSEIERTLLAEGQWNGELKHVTRDGHSIEVSSRWVLWKRDGKAYGWLEINRDITEHKRVEAHLRDTQKMESLGVLAGGIAHDFNNLLTGIMGNVSLAMDMAEAESPVYKAMINALRASEQAAFLTKQILAYAGKGQFVTQPVNLSAVVRDAVSLIGSSIPKAVQIQLDLQDQLPPVEADTSQIQQVAMNLIFNAAEAIGDRAGRVTIRTGVQELGDRESADTFEIGSTAPGRWVVLEVRDTGQGIEPVVRPNMFDPFFTTKFMGRGLGLAAVSGIVRSLRGAIAVDSTPGQGTLFRVLLPAMPGSAAEAPRPPEPILVVDDEEIVRRTAEAMLSSRGYEVVLAENGAQALDLFRRANGKFSLVILDMAMPVMSGEEAFRELKAIRPDVPIIVSSGFSEQEAIRRFGGLGVSDFIQKPYTVQSLMETLRSVLPQ